MISKFVVLHYCLNQDLQNFRINRIKVQKNHRTHSETQ